MSGNTPYGSFRQKSHAHLTSQKWHAHVQSHAPHTPKSQTGNLLHPLTKYSPDQNPSQKLSCTSSDWLMSLCVNCKDKWQNEKSSTTLKANSGYASSATWEWHFALIQTQDKLYWVRQNTTFICRLTSTTVETTLHLFWNNSPLWPLTPPAWWKKEMFLMWRMFPSWKDREERFENNLSDPVCRPECGQINYHCYCRLV